MEKTCFNCANWEHNKKEALPENWIPYTGSCDTIRKELDIELDYAPYSGGASVSIIDTEPDFGCIRWEQAEWKEVE
jgi:hypothetical protein|tara:strand:+ start:433 stop:660 length:228 start_codon:yes stop_codon:yes gene_type:complete